MANTPDYSWPPMESRKVIGKPHKRLDGPQKASGRAKYTSDLKMKDLLYAAYLTCPHGHARRRRSTASRPSTWSPRQARNSSGTARK